MRSRRYPRGVGVAADDGVENRLMLRADHRFIAVADISLALPQIERARRDQADAQKVYQLGVIGVLARAGDDVEIGRAHVCTPVTTAHLVCCIMLEKKKPLSITTTNIIQS